MPRPLQGAILCLGNFDGLHLGHRSLLEAARKRARDHDLPLALMSAEPHPRSVFAESGHTPFRLASPAQKYGLLASAGIDYLFEPTFDTAFAAQSPETFLRSVLVENLHIGGIVCGSDFRFGAGRAGDPGMIRAFCASRGLLALTVEKTLSASSTTVRRALSIGDFRTVHAHLGRNWQIDLRATGIQIRPPAGRYLAQHPSSGARLMLSIGGDGRIEGAGPVRDGRFMDILAKL